MKWHVWRVAPGIIPRYCYLRDVEARDFRTAWKAAKGWYPALTLTTMRVQSRVSYETEALERTTTEHPPLTPNVWWSPPPKEVEA